MQEEIWKNYVYNYDVSNLGRIRNNKTNYILSQSLAGKGYLGVTVSLGERGKIQRIRTHRAVAELFIPNPNNLPQINHIDGNKTNNKVENLEWCTNQENTIHAIQTGLKDYSFMKGEKNLSAKLTKEDVEYIRKNYISGSRTFGARALGRKFGVHHETIRQIINNETWK